MNRLAWFGLPLIAAMAVGCTTTVVRHVSGGTQLDYESCGGDGDCYFADDFCIDVVNDGTLGSMCSQGCQRDSDCPSGGICEVLDPYPGPICYLPCGGGGGCPAGFACYSVTAIGDICLPDTGPQTGSYNFEECFGSGSDCAFYDSLEPSKGSQCFTVAGAITPAQMCSLYCSSDADCPSGATCDNPDGPSICYLTCQIDADCPQPFVCASGECS